jgi:hypothetical protein
MGCLFKETIATMTPSLAQAIATARPMPLKQPATNAAKSVLPNSGNDCSETAALSVPSRWKLPIHAMICDAKHASRC